MSERINIGQLHRWEELKRYEYKHGLLSDEMIAALEAEGFDFEAQPEYSLAADLPWLADEWNYEKNGSLTPNEVTVGSDIKVWWRCSKGHEWRVKINSRSQGDGCPFCSGRYAIIGVNDLAVKRPELAAEWDYEKNGSLTPEDVTVGSNKKVWWKCSKGHEYPAQVKNRCTGRGCPYCSGQLVLAGFNDLATIRPDLAAEWNYEKNGSLTPRDVTAGSGKKVWWKCSKGHEWQAWIKNRSKGSGCKECYKERLGRL